MGWIKFTSFKTGKTYDSRYPQGNFIVTREVQSKEQTLNESDIYDRQPLFKYPKGKENWIDDPLLADALDCSVEEIDEKLKELIK